MSAKIMPFQDSDADRLPEIPSPAVRIHLGCNQRPRPGWINVDIEPFQGVDVVADLEKPWPWPDNHADEVACADLPEHLRMCWEEPDPAWVQKARQNLPLSGNGSGNLLTAVECLFRAIEKPVRHYGIIHFMNEAYRVLKPGGRLDALIPSTDGRGWSQDPTHVSHWNENSILYFTDPGYMGLYPHLIKCKWKILKLTTTIRNPLEICWIHVILEAEKT